MNHDATVQLFRVTVKFRMIFLKSIFYDPTFNFPYKNLFYFASLNRILYL